MLFEKPEYFENQAG